MILKELEDKYGNKLILRFLPFGIAKTQQISVDAELSKAKVISKQEMSPDTSSSIVGVAR